MENKLSLRKRLYQGQNVLGFCLCLPSPGTMECIGAGWDWVWIDGQHGQHEYRSLLECVRAADACGVPSVVRTSGHEYGLIGPVLDLAVSGVMVPMVNNPAEAKQVVEAVRFPPIGGRSIGGRRVVDILGRDYCHTANEEVLLVAQIETPEALEQAEAIAAVEGVDALFFGPDDYKLRRGIPINTGVLESDELLRAMEKMATAARNAGKIAGTITATPAVLQRLTAVGYQLNAGGSEVEFMKMGNQQRLSELRGAGGA